MNTANSLTKFPFYAKITLLFIGACFLICLLYLGQQIILPILYATLISVLLNPIVNFLVNHKFRRLLAIAIAVLVAILFSIGLIYLISSQLKMFQATFPKLE